MLNWPGRVHGSVWPKRCGHDCRFPALDRSARCWTAEPRTCHRWARAIWLATAPQCDAPDPRNRSAGRWKWPGARNATSCPRKWKPGSRPRLSAAKLVVCSLLSPRYLYRNFNYCCSGLIINLFKRLKMISYLSGCCISIRLLEKFSPLDWVSNCSKIPFGHGKGVARPLFTPAGGKVRTNNFNCIFCSCKN